MDAPLDGNAMAGLLEEVWGHDITAAADGPEAIAAVGMSPPDVVLMDIGLPTIDGYETAERIRKVVEGAAPRSIAYIVRRLKLARNCLAVLQHQNVGGGEQRR